jgi:hypothetical protein
MSKKTTEAKYHRNKYRIRFSGSFYYFAEYKEGLFSSWKYISNGYSNSCFASEAEAEKAIHKHAEEHIARQKQERKWMKRRYIRNLGRLP